MGSLGTNEPIAIVGMACRLPGDISSPCELWDFLAQEKSGQSDFPKNRLNIDSWYHPDSQRPGSISTKGGYFLSDGDSFRHFDPSFFRISPLEAASMDPQQRKLLEVVYESFESAGISLQDVAGSNTGCFVGNFTWDVGQMQARDVEYSTPYEMTGGGLTILSNRVNYVFDLKGPSLTLDTACSSTMYALHLACKSLQAGECSAAVVGGTNIIFGVEQQIGSVKLGTLSPTSICHTFDEAADGYARGEAVGSVYIKRLSDAIRDNNPIRAIIRATAVNTNGRGLGMNRPSTFDQEAVIRKAYASAGLDFDHTAYLESHGTGTPTGDPIEFSAIGNVFGPLHQPDTPLLIGSVKPNLGHGEAASTIPSLIKTVLSLEKAEIPATIGIRTFNPKLDFHGGRLKIVQKLTPWPAEQGYRRASVNSFGYGGANAHAILDAAESYLGQISTQIHRLPSPEIRAPPTSPQSYYLLPFSAHNQQTLEKNFAAMSEVCNTFHLRDLAYTLSTGRSSLPVRGFTVVAESQDGTVGHLLSDTVLKTAEQEAGAPGLAFVFTGQGAQWPRMAMSLIDEYPSVLESIKEMDDILAMLPEPPTWTILETLSASKMTSRINDADRSQTVCTAVQVSIVRLLRSWGIDAKANVGHSSGEIAAAFASGYLTLRQAIIIAYLRGQAVARNNIPGAMLAVGIGAAEVTQFIEPLTDICIACHNSPNSVTLSGTTAAIDEAHGIFSRLGVFSRKLVTSGNAYHSQLMSLAGIDYEDQLLQRLSHEEAPTPGTTSPIMVSSVTGTTVTSGLDLQYWRRNLESPVLFSQAVQRLVEEMPDARLLVEIGPHSALGGPIKEIRSGLGLGANRLQYLSTLKRNSNGVENMLNLGGSLYLSGYPVALNRLNAHCETSEKPRYITEIPRYQWVYDELHWSESRLSAEIRFRDHPRHDLLGSLLPGCSKSSPSWRNIIELKELPWINDHKVGEDIVFPAAGYISLAIAAASQATGLPFQQNSYTLQNVKIKSAMVMKQGVGTEMIVDLRVLESPHADFDFAVSTVTAGKWMVHAAGTIRVHSDSIPTVFANQPAGSSLQTHPNGVNQATQDRRWYYKMGQVGLVYGPSFRTLSNIRSTTTENEAVADVTSHLDEAYTAHASAYLIHPTIIDACLQLSIIAAHEGDPDNLVKSYLPVAIEQMTIFGPTIGRNSIQPAAIRGRGIPKGLRSIETVVELTDGGGDVLLEARLSFLSLESSINSQSQSRVPQPYSRLVWKPSINHLSSDQLRSLLTTPALNTGFMDPLGNLMDLIAHSDPRLNIIELGEVSVGPSLSILSALQGESDVPNYVKYVFVSTATELLTASQDGFKAYKNLHFQGFDMTKDISSQGFDEGALDVAVAPALYGHEPHPLVHEIEKICAERLIPTKRLPFTDYPNISSDNTRTIMLAELEAPLLSRMTEADMKAMQHYTQTASTSVWVTNCDVLVGKEPEKTLVFGIAKSIMTEQPSFRIASIDVDPDATEAIQLSASARLVMDLEDKFHRHVEGMDTEVVEKHGIVYTSRYIGDEVGNAEFAQTFNPEPKVAPIRENLSLAFDKIGRLGSYYFSDTEPSTGSVGDDEIVVESRAFGFDQTGVAIAKGQKNHPFFSSEAGGIVLKTGKLVQSVQPGDRVVCLKPNKFETTVVVKEGLCLPIKPTDEFSDIVGQLLPFTFAIHTLREACQLDEQSRVLVDVTSPCLSLAVAQVALLTTPDVYATWASEEQKSMLSNLPGIKLVELSSLPDISVSIIVTNGELEMGAPLRRIADRAARLALLAGRSFTDLAGLSSSLMEKQLRISYHDPMQMTSLGDGISKALQQTMQCWGNGAIKPVPSQAYDLSNFAEAASSISTTQAQAVLTCSPGATKVPIKSLPRPLKFDDSASYLLIGCLGGLGRSLTMWMISRGARNFVFLSRSGADKPEAAALAAELRGMVGVTIQIVRGDVTKRQDVAAAITEARQPIKGVVQAAMVLHELLFTELTLKQWKQVIDSKVAGTINLHELLLDHDLDFFVMCSSVLGAIGAATQSNYAAANSFLDAMARHRHSLGLQAASVALGMILDVGHVEEHPEVETALKRNGMYGIGVSEYLHAMELGCRGRQRPQDGEHPLSITTNGTTTATSSAPPPGWWGYYDAAAAAHIVTGMDPTRVTRAGGKGMWLSDNRLRNLLLALGDDQSGADPESSSSSSSQSVTARLRAAAAEGEGGREAVRMVVQQLFMERLSKLVLLPVAKMTPSSPLSLYGMDSMISAELRSWAWKEFKANIPFMSLLDHSLTFEGLAELAVSLMDADSGVK
ncbi:KR domain-containing protein [Colletotrichum musicola]|uniref:KR domain-containing protein n=1 Tax=Colletotrichum musicola TaxID=2175873 RepID=A0A8H6NB92_9PEZI|nr:KR domain-containing protein [Colletotrichum musicola]